MVLPSVNQAAPLKKPSQSASTKGSLAPIMPPQKAPSAMLAICQGCTSGGRGWRRNRTTPVAMAASMMAE